MDSVQYAWEKSDGKKRLRYLENALKTALDCGLKIADILDASPMFNNFIQAPHYLPARDALNLQALQSWTQDIRDVHTDHERFRVSVGVQGDTGTGKSSMLNALLGYKEMLPSNNQRAATATVCRVAYNHADDNFRAVIHFHERKDFITVIGQFLKEYHATAEDDVGEGDATGVGEEGTFQANLDLFRVVWGLDEKAISRITTAESIIKDGDFATELLSTSKTLESFSKDEFAIMVKPYLDSIPLIEPGKTSESGRFVWPLVHHVEVFLRADILAGGVALVDLPGLSDADESRSMVARRFFNELDISTIVAPAVRVADGASTMALLDENAAMSMQLDDRLNKRRFCVVASMSDNIEWRAHIATLGAASKAVRQASALLQALCGERKAVDKQIADGQASLSKLQSARLKNEAKIAAERAQQLERHTSRDGLIKRIKSTEGRIAYLCIAERNKNIIAHIQEDFRRRKQQLTQSQESGDEAVSVVPISAKAFWQAIESDVERTEGFPSVNYSGVPALRAWIVEASAPAREAHASEMLTRLRVLLNAIQTWSEGQCKGTLVKYPWDKIDENIMSPLRKSLSEALLHNEVSIYGKLQEVNPFYGNTRRVLAACVPKIQDSVQRWVLKNPDVPAERPKNGFGAAYRMHFTTYNAIINRHGGEFVSRPKTHRTQGTIQYAWMGTMARIFFAQRYGVWDVAIHRKLPEYANEARDSVKAVWDETLEYLEGMLSLQFPARKIYVQKQLRSLTATRDEIADRTHRAVSDLSADAAKLHPGLADSIKYRWSRGFAQAKKITGKGHFALRQKALEEYSKRNSGRFFKEAEDQMKAKFEESQARLPHKLKKVWQLATIKVERQLGIIFNNILEVEYPDRDAKRHLEDQEELQVQLRPHIMTWVAAWMLADPASSGIDAIDTAIPDQYVEEVQAIEADDDSDDDFDMDLMDSEEE